MNDRLLKEYSLKTLGYKFYMFIEKSKIDPVWGFDDDVEKKFYILNHKQLKKKMKRCKELEVYVLYGYYLYDIFDLITSEQEELLRLTGMCEVSEHGNKMYDDFISDNCDVNIEFCCTLEDEREYERQYEIQEEIQDINNYYKVLETSNNYYIVTFKSLSEMKRTQPNTSYNLLNDNVYIVFQYVSDKKLDQLEVNEIININDEYKQYTSYNGK